jgi:hypothetical protein
VAHGEKITYQSSSLKVSSLRSFAFTYIAYMGYQNAVKYNVEIDGSLLEHNNYTFKDGFDTHYFKINKETPIQNVKISLTPQGNIHLISLGLSSASNQRKMRPKC